jgi:hydrogenase maturation protease
LPARFFRSSTHAFGVGDAVELARTLGRLPSRMVVYGVEGSDFDAGAALSPPVLAAVDNVVRRLEEELCTNGH